MGLSTHLLLRSSRPAALIDPTSLAGMEEAFAARGLEVFASGTSSQGVQLSDMFKVLPGRDPAVLPVLKPLGE